MNPENLEDIIEFAIAREKDAVRLYSDLKNKVLNEKAKAYLGKLVDMELNHAAVLENMDTKSVADIDLTKLKILQNSPFYKKEKPTELMDLDEVYKYAVSREEASYKLYTLLAEETGDDNLKKIFLKLASDEAGHRDGLEKLLKSI